MSNSRKVYLNVIVLIELNLGNGFLAQIGRILECSLVFKGKRTKLKIGAEEVELIQTIGAKGLGREHSQDPQETKSERLRGREYSLPIYD